MSRPPRAGAIPRRTWWIATDARPSPRICHLNRRAAKIALTAEELLQPSSEGEDDAHSPHSDDRGSRLIRRIRRQRPDRHQAFRNPTARPSVELRGEVLCRAGGNADE